MPIEYGKIATKFQAIRSKSIGNIVSQGVYIPFMGNAYSRDEVKAWLDIRAEVLEFAQQASNVTQITNARQALYGELCASCKLIADKVIAGQEYDLQSCCGAMDYNRLCFIILYIFAVTP